MADVVSVNNFLKYTFMNTSIRVFMLPDKINSNDSESWFVAKDICDVLELKNSRAALSKLDNDEKCLCWIDGSGGPRLTSIINEYGLYNLILKTRTKIARPFKRWLTHEVLPSLCKHGIYITDDTMQHIQSNPNIIHELLQEVEALKQKLIKYEQTRVPIDPIDEDDSGYVYVASTEAYAKKHIHKIGATKDPDARIVALNTSRDISDSMFMIKTYPVSNYKNLEKKIHNSLDKYRNSHKREFFTIELGELTNIIETCL